jgi:16S rRNA (guanine527-N7)-methyltransferase
MANPDFYSHFIPEFSAAQIELLCHYEYLLGETNKKLNLISRADAVHLAERHILHSLSVWKTGVLKPDMQVLDIGTGGGLPGIPLSIACDTSTFVLIDRIGKKAKAVQEMIAALGLKNAEARQADTGEIKQKFDLITARAVTALPDFIKFAAPLLKKGGKIAYLKGGDFEEELKTLGWPHHLYPISKWFPTAFFETKKVVVI